MLLGFPTPTHAPGRPVQAHTPSRRRTSVPMPTCPGEPPPCIGLILHPAPRTAVSSPRGRAEQSTCIGPPRACPVQRLTRRDTSAKPQRTGRSPPRHPAPAPCLCHLRRLDKPAPCRRGGLHVRPPCRLLRLDGPDGPGRRLLGHPGDAGWQRAAAELKALVVTSTRAHRQRLDSKVRSPTGMKGTWEVR